MQKAFQTEWFGINFSSLTLESVATSSDDDFYRVFYAEFRSRYNSYSDLDVSWRRAKEGQFQDLLLLADGSKKMLSIGSGIGYLEFLLAEDTSKAVTAIEPFANFSDWMGPRVQFHQGFFPHALNDFDFDFVFLSAVDFALNNSDYLALLADIRQRIDAKVALTGLHVPSFAPRSVLQRAGAKILGVKDRESRFWGHFRTIKEQIRLLEKVGYRIVDCGKHRDSSNYWILVD